MKEKSEREKLNDELKEVPVSQINTKERGIARARYVPFSRYCFWLLSRYADNEDIFYVKELCQYAKITANTAYRFFDDLKNLGYTRKSINGNVVFYELTKNDEHIKLLELLPYIKKTLKIK